MSKKISAAAALVAASLTAWAYLEYNRSSTEPPGSKAPPPPLEIQPSIKDDVAQDEVAYSKSAIVINGQEINIVLRSPELEYHALDGPQSALERISKFLPLAESGDVVASSIVASELARCDSKKLKRNGDRNASIQSLVDDNDYVEKSSPGMSYSTADGKIINLVLNTNTLANSHKIHQEEISYCEGIDKALEAKTFDYAEYAASKGDYPAQKLLLELEYENDDIKYEVVKNLWEKTGSVGTLYEMSTMQSKALIDEIKTGKKNSQNTDNVLAYALVLVASKLNLVALERDGQEITSDILSSNDQGLAYYSQNLSPSEHSDAEKLALEIISNNPNCCLY